MFYDSTSEKLFSLPMGNSNSTFPEHSAFLKLRECCCCDRKSLKMSLLLACSSLLSFSIFWEYFGFISVLQFRSLESTDFSLGGREWGVRSHIDRFIKDWDPWASASTRGYSGALLRHPRVYNIDTQLLWKLNNFLLRDFPTYLTNHFTSWYILVLTIQIRHAGTSCQINDWTYSNIH